MSSIGSALLWVAASVIHVPASQVDAAFAKGAPLVENPGYKVHASRREKPGEAEVHVRDIDIIHVIEGSARLVTGGEVTDRRTVAADEFRGSAIRGGETVALQVGDVVVVPSGVPHQFVSVSDPFVYYVVKVDAGGAKR